MDDKKANSFSQFTIWCLLLPSLHHNKEQNIMYDAYYGKCDSKQNLNHQAF